MGNSWMDHVKKTGEQMKAASNGSTVMLKQILKKASSTYKRTGTKKSKGTNKRRGKKGKTSKKRGGNTVV